MAEKKYRFPRTMGTCADKLYNLKKARLELKKKVDEMENEEKALKKHIIDNLPKSNASGVQGKVARVSVIKSDEPHLEDRESFRKYIMRKKRYDLAYALRPANAAIKEMWDDGQEIPGIGRFTVVSVSLNKI